MTRPVISNLDTFDKTRLVVAQLHEKYSMDTVVEPTILL